MRQITRRRQEIATPGHGSHGSSGPDGSDGSHGSSGPDGSDGSDGSIELSETGIRSPQGTDPDHSPMMEQQITKRTGLFLVH